MANTYSQIHLQYIFAVKGRDNLLKKPWRDEVFKYISGLVKGKNQKPIIVNGVSDHVHVFLGLRPTMNITDLVRDIKNNSANFINKQRYIRGDFAWQEGYGVFSYGHSQIQKVYQYVANQELHHKNKSFKEEYLEFLQKFEVEYDNAYLFDWLES